MVQVIYINRENKRETYTYKGERMIEKKNERFIYPIDGASNIYK